MKRGRKTAILLLAVLLALQALLAPAFAQEKKTRLIRVGFPRFEGYQMMGGAGEKSGYAYDYLQHMKLFTNWSFEYVGYDSSWEEIQNMLERGEIDMVACAAVTPERRERFDYSDRSIASEATALAVSSLRESACRQGKYETYNGLRIGLLKDSIQERSLETFAAENVFSYTAMYYPDVASLSEALSGGEVDAIAISSLNPLEHITKIELFDAQPICIEVRKGDEQLLEEVNSALEQLSILNPDLGDRLYEKYYSDADDNQPFFTTEEWEYINACQGEGRSFSVLLDPQMAPYSERSGESFTGAMADIAKLFSQRCGLRFEFLPVENSEEYSAALESGEADLWFNARNDFNYAESLGYRLTEPYCAAGISRLSLKNGKKADDTVAVVKNSDVANLLSSRRSDKSLVYYDSREECVRAVLSGKCGETCLATLSAQRAAAKDETRSLTTTLMAGAQVEYCVGINEGCDPRLGAIMSKVIDSAGSAKISGILDGYSRESTQKDTFVGFIYSNLLSTVLIIILIFTVTIVGIVLRAGKRQRRLVQRQNSEMELALNEAERANCAKSDFLSRMSHDMRTPMNAIIGFSADIDEMDEQTAKDNLRLISSSAQHLLTLINDTLDMSKIESGKVELHMTAADGREVFTSIASSFEQSMREKGIDFIVSIPDDHWTPIKLDVARVKQIVMNLLSNALKFTPEGGRIEYSFQNLGVENGYMRSKIVVRDTGCGMSGDFISHIFEPFSQEQNCFSESYAGSGLGMPIVKRLLELMDGNIIINSEQGEGTEITLSLDFEVAFGPEEECGGRLEENSLSGMKVLLVEDHDINALVAGRLLAKECVISERAVNGQEAVDMFLASPVGYYEAILMDIRMPVMDGYEATRTIRSLERADAQTVQIIAMTANAFDEDKRESFAAGMNEHLGKPIEPKKLYLALQTAREKRA